MSLSLGRSTLAGVLAASLAALVLVASPPAAQAAPNNDDFADAQVVAPAGALVTDSNADSTPEDGEPDHAQTGWGALHSVWYSWTPSASGVVPISTCGSSFATRVGVYTGSSLATLSGPSSKTPTSNGACPGTAWGGLDVQVSAGTTYWIAVDTWGGVSEDGSYEQTDQTTGLFQLQVGEGNDAITEQPTEVTVPGFLPRCSKKVSAEKCYKFKGKVRFKYLQAVRTWADEVRAQGGDVTLVESGQSKGGQDGSVHDALRDLGKGTEILSQSIKPGTTFFTTVDEPIRLKVGFFDIFQDKAMQQATLQQLEEAGEDNKEVKSKCKYIATDAKPSEILTALNADLGKTGYVTQAVAGRLLEQKGCGYEVSEYFDAPGMPTDFVDEVTGVDKKRDLIKLRVGLPVAQDFLLVVREDPTFATTTMLGLGTDGKLTASRNQLSRVTVQVVERITGRLVSGARVTFIGTDGGAETRSTNERGEWTFTSKLVNPGSYSLKAEVVGANGARMAGFRSLQVVDRGTSSFVTMSGRAMTYANGDWVGTQADVDRARALAVVPANLGTGLLGEPTAPPKIEQARAAYPNGDGTWTAGEHNSLRIPDDTNFAVGAAPGLVVLGGGFDGQVGRPEALRAWPNPFQAIADAVNYICTGLTKAFEQSAGTVAAVTTAAQQQAVRTAAQTLAANGAAVPPNGLISDKGLGLITDNGGGLISDKGLGVVNVQGLQLRDAQGNLIGQAGGNLIGQAGGNVISVGGGNFTPVPGGNLIGQAGGN